MDALLFHSAHCARLTPEGSMMSVARIAPPVACAARAAHFHYSAVVFRSGEVASGARRNDSDGQMRNMARPMTESEIEAVATFYARKAP